MKYDVQDERLQNVLGHFQKDFEGGVLAENLGKGNKSCTLFAVKGYCSCTDVCEKSFTLYRVTIRGLWFILASVPAFPVCCISI